MRSNSSSRHKTRIGVDIGGTFTDVVVVDPGGTVSARKVSSTPQDYAEGVLHGIRAAVGELPLELSEPAEIIHATTIATNAILERKGPRCGLLTTKGFRDVLEIGRLRMPKLYNIFYEKRPPLRLPYYA